MRDQKAHMQSLKHVNRDTSQIAHNLQSPTSGYHAVPHQCSHSYIGWSLDWREPITPRRGPLLDAGGPNLCQSLFEPSSIHLQALALVAPVQEAWRCTMWQWSGRFDSITRSCCASWSGGYHDDARHNPPRPNLVAPWLLA